MTTDQEGATHKDNCTIKICTAGQYVNPDDTSICLDCPKDTYQTVSTPQLSDECHKCGDNMGTRENKRVNDSFCEPVCPAGKQYNEDTRTCEDCMQGYWSDGGETMKFDGCVECQNNYTTVGEGSISESNCTLLDCPPGSYIKTVGNTETCELCDEGYYQSERHQTSCEECGVNLSSGRGAKSKDECNKQCPAGQEGANECKPCEDDHFKAEEGGVACSQCSEDKTSDEDRLTCALVRCSPGKYYKKDGDTESCEPCAIGMFKDEKANTNCSKCPEGKTTPSTGAVNVEGCSKLYCLRGQYHKETGEKEECIKCEVGKYKNFTGNDAGCSDCPELFETDGEGKTSVEACYLHICPEGEYRNDNNECKKCEHGKFQNVTGQQSCKSCGAGQTTLEMGSTSEDKCVPYCEKGEYYVNTTEKCLKCDLGYYKETAGNAAECEKCVTGRTTNIVGATKKSDCKIDDCKPGQKKSAGEGCEDCPKGSYQPAYSQTDCISCEEGKTTVGKASTNKVQCIAKCKDGEEYNYMSALCDKCPKGFITNRTKSEFCVTCPPGETTYKEGALACSTMGSVTAAPVRVVKLVIVMKFRVTNCWDSDNYGIYMIRIKITIIANLKKLAGKYKRLCNNANNQCETIKIKIKRKGGNCDRASRKKREVDNDELEFEVEVPDVDETLENSETGASRRAESILEEDFSDVVKYTPEEGQIDFKGLTSPVIKETACLAGYESVNGDCRICPAGKKEVDDVCVDCEKDSYQDQAGQMTCKRCEGSTATTAGEGSVSIEDCQSACDTNPNYCSNGGRCKSDGFGIRCECTDSYEGDRCESYKDPSKSSNQDVIIGATIGGIAGLLIIILISVGIIKLLQRRKSPGYDKTSMKSKQDQELFPNPIYDNGVMTPYYPGYASRMQPYVYPIEDYDPTGLEQMGNFDLYGENVASSRPPKQQSSFKWQ
ncbi:hypothetical protein ScPMuIL_004068 [Solemya velum]